MDVNGFVYTSNGIEKLVVLATRVNRDKDREQVGHAKDLFCYYIIVLIYWLLSRLLYKVIKVSNRYLNLRVVHTEINYYVDRYDIIANTIMLGA
jgi:hypothetical protein